MTNNKRFFAELVVLLTVGGVLYAKATPVKQDEPDYGETIRAQNFVVEDKDGNPLAVLGSGTPPKDTGIKGRLTSLAFLPSKHGKAPAGILIGVMDDGRAIVAMETKSGYKPKSTLAISMDGNGNPSVVLLSKGKKPRVLKA